MEVDRKLPLWKVRGRIRTRQRAREAWSRWDARTVLLAAKDFAEVVELAESAIAYWWSNDPWEVEVLSINPVVEDGEQMEVRLAS